jgi:Tol biopolymer transport system component
MATSTPRRRNRGYFAALVVATFGVPLSSTVASSAEPTVEMVTPLTETPGIGERDPFWGSDGLITFVTDDGDGSDQDIATIEPDGSNRTTILEDPDACCRQWPLDNPFHVHGVHAPSWSSDNQHLVFDGWSAPSPPFGAFVDVFRISRAEIFGADATATLMTCGPVKADEVDDNPVCARYEGSPA